MKLKEFSRRIGLSPTTVSRALGGYSGVSDRTRRKVLEAAERLGYTPNFRAARLATGRAMTIGHILPLSKERQTVNPVFSDFIAGAGERLSRSGYSLSFSVVRDEDEAETYRDLAASGAVDGVVLHGPKVDDPRIRLLLDLDLPFVVHGRSSNVQGDYDWVDVNNRRAFSRATEFLLDLGHRRIGLINGPDGMDFANRRLAGYVDAIMARGIARDPELVFGGEMTENHGFATTMRMLGSSDPPTAILVSSIIPAMGARRALHDLGMGLGDEVSVVIHDDDLSYFRNEGDVPIFTATRSSVRKAGRLCASILLEAIRGAREGHRHVLLEADLMLGRSTGPAPAMRRLLGSGQS